MPRDDLRIDFVRGRDMPPLEQQDCAAVLDEWTNRVANLPAELAFMQEEIAEKDRLLEDCRTIINKNDAAIQKWIRMNGSHAPNPKEDGHRKQIVENFDKAEILQSEKVALAKKAEMIMDKHTRWLDGHIKALQERGEFPKDLDIPSTLRPQAHDRIRMETSSAMTPLSQVSNPAAVITRHPNQYPQRPLPTQIQTQLSAGAVTTASPTTPAAALMLQRQAREASAGASSKRQRLTGGLGSLPPNPSNLGRHSSVTPGTPKATTPLPGRAGSAGPRASQKITTTKKVAPQGSRQSGAPRRGKPGKSGLSRVKRVGNKNSPSSTNDSELSEADSGSVDEDDEAATPSGANKDGEGDEEMVDIEDDEGADDKKYCICHSVSYGDMVGCDNDECELEWFHWSCVGIKTEPVGRWICPVCTAKAKARKG